MLRLATDADFNGDMLRGLRRLRPNLAVVRVQDVGLRTADDPTILDWAANEGRVLLTHDRKTMPDYAYDRVRIGQPMPGVFVVRNELPFGPILDELALIDECSTHAEWDGRVVYLPL